MSKKGNDISGANIDIVSGRIANGVLNNNVRATAVDKIKSLLSDVKDRHQNTEPGVYFGYCLYSARWTVAHFQSLFPPESKFYKDVIFAKNKKKANPAASILCNRVHIPEITGMLPFPDMTKIFNLQKLYEEESFDDSKIEKKINGALRAAAPEIAKIDLQPKFYTYTLDNNTVPIGQLCKVKFLENSYPTRGLGLFIEMLESNISDCEDPDNPEAPLP